MSGRRGIATAIAAAVAALCATDSASAYVRRRTDGGIPESWQVGCVTATVYLNGFTMMTSDEVAKSIAAAAHAWSPDAITCSDGSHPYFEVAIAVNPDGQATAAVQNDGKNSIVFQTRSWPDLDAAALAVTSAFVSADGRILDSDIQIHATPDSGIQWGNLDLNASSGGGTHIELFDLQNALTHEMGHFIGLDHNCVKTATPDGPVDDKGQPVPSCDSAPPALRLATMWFDTMPGETSQRYLTDDEVRAMCDIYPASRDPHNCALDVADDGFGCSLGGGSAPATAGMSPDARREAIPIERSGLLAASTVFAVVAALSFLRVRRRR